MYNFRHISVGELLRDEQASGSENGKVIASILNDGRIVPVKMSLDLLRAAMLATPLRVSNDNASYKDRDRSIRDSTLGYAGFLIDGFPRNADNVRGWEVAKMQDVCDVRGCLFLDCSVSTLRERLLHRGKTALSSGSDSGSNRRELSRADDAAETIAKRLQVFEGITSPVVEHYTRQGILWTVDGNQTVENVTKAAIKILDANLR
jgi:UMP-CMP kinase